LIPLGSKALFGFGTLALVASIAYGVATNEPTTTVVLGFAAFGAYTLGVALALASADLPPAVAPDAPIAEQYPVGARPARPSLWPFAAALGFGLLAVGVSTQGIVLIAAAVVLTLVGSGWLVQQWTEHPGYAPVFGGRLQERFLLPFGLPVAVIGLVATILISLSRVFLALPEQGTRAVALAVALVILFSAFAVAASKRMARTALMLLSGFALACVIGAGAVGIVHGERKFEAPKLANTFVPAPGQATTTTSTTAAPSATTTTTP
jgi:hypothetical protein